ncbi:replication initiator protein A [Paracraurococcus lichenis]|uniref:Replication initiator protein A n=1 Tax=Paracraurococcus lichenis TaxID=3064888 RepID=A0ABT9EDG4_9PROT|nr:replication initiator protein A [Paracraurococcus sp. LOR1-02]MDO9714258.1 replication initiator protein A [Paracraurococcus sp. LOR1-02]
MLALELQLPPDRFRNEAELSGYPLFGVETRPSLESVNFTDGRRTFRVVPDQHHGLPTMGDKALILALVSILVRALDNGQHTSPNMTLRAADLIRAIRPSARGRTISANEYADLRASLRRLSTAEIQTNVTAGKKRFEGFFRLLSEVNFVTEKDGPGEGKLQAIELVLCEWLYRAVVFDRRFHRISHRYLELSPLARRIYEIGKRHTYNKEDPRNPRQSRAIPLQEYRTLVGSRTQRLTDFKKTLIRCLQSEDIPEVSVHLVGDRTSEAGRIVAEAGFAPCGGRRRTRSSEVHVIYVPRPATEPPRPEDEAGQLVMVEDVLVGGAGPDPV